MSTNKKHGIITKVSGPLIVAKGMEDVQVYDVVHISEKRLIGEVIELRGDRASIQVYEETAGLGPGEPVWYTGGNEYGIHHSDHGRVERNRRGPGP